MTLLAIDKLSLRFGNAEVVKHVSLTINKGEMLALVGESGSGKSLTALSCLGLQPEAADISGSIRFDGITILSAGQETCEPSAMPHARASRPAAGAIQMLRGKRIGMIFQEPMTALNPLHTIGKQIGEMLSPAGWRGPDQTPQQVRGLLDQVGLSHFKDRLDTYPHQLSGGERQRVMIAMAIANKPDLLIADEPTTAVDVTIQVKILALLKELQKTMGMAILFITHDLTVVKRLSDRVAVMKAGEIVEQGKVADVFANPKHSYTKMLLASEPKGAPPPAPANAPVIMACENLKVHFPIKRGVFRRTVGVVKAVEDVSLTIPESTTLGVVGESGSGKTTLAFALLRLLKSEGNIVFLGQDIAKLQSHAIKPLRSKMQVVFQDPYSSLNPRMNIRQIIEEGLLVHAKQLSQAQREHEVDRVLAEVGLGPEVKNRYPHEFSGGQRQRISIARAMVLRPAFVVLDEPTSALDLTIQAQITDLLKKLQQKYGLSYMFISHDLRVVRAISHRIVVMREGKIVEENDTASLFSAPKNEYTKKLIDAAFLKG